MTIEEFTTRLHVADENGLDACLGCPCRDVCDIIALYEEARKLKDNPKYSCECMFAIYQKHLEILDARLKEEAAKEFHCGFEESGFYAYNCNDCPNKCEEWHQWDKEFKSMTRKINSIERGEENGIHENRRVFRESSK